ncbi:hypothetical protein MMC07_005169 [Pseudocyphellaria aurata]|nr:hypothetical protein [Pseudocyphellaria aurata]
MATDNSFRDLSGVGVGAASSENPYHALIEACKGDPALIKRCYQIHRQSRNKQQAATLLSPGFTGWLLDPVLQKLVDAERHPGYSDPRNCLVFWARPPEHLRKLINTIQERLVQFNPDLWLMPADCLHMTALELTHSRSQAEIEELVHVLRSKIPEITDYTLDHRARLVQPWLSYDSQAIALSFLPCSRLSVSEVSTHEADAYTYHHLRRDLYDLCSTSGATVASRYVVPSAHLTIARFVTHEGLQRNDQGVISDPGYMAKWIQHLNEINVWLEEEYWPRPDSLIKEGGEWIVGEEKGLECRKGTLWYGGGERVRLGRGF